MRVVVLGSAGTRPGLQRACASHLVEHDGYRLLLDCGNGSLSNLVSVCDPADVDAVVISHQHLDHWADLVGMYYARWLGAGGPIPVYGPPGLGAHIAQVLPPGDDVFLDICRFHPTRPGDRLDLGPLHMELFEANHPVPTLATRIKADQQVLAYSADSAPTSQLVDAARDADLLIADCTWLGQPDSYPAGVHMTAAEAGQLARTAGVHRLLASHIWPTNDPAAVQAEIKQGYSGEVLVAEDLSSIDLSGTRADGSHGTC